MKGKLLKILAVCLILLFTATAAYASEGKAKGKSTGQGHYSQDENKNNKPGGEDKGKKDDKGDKGSKGSKGDYKRIIDEDDEDDEDDKDSCENCQERNCNQVKNRNQGKKAPGYVAVTGITLSKTSTTLAVKSWERLSATVQPANAKDKKYFWFSSNPRVASVNPSGKITGLAPGTAVIYVATRDGFKTASCTVTVGGSPAVQVRVTGVRLSSSNLTLDVGAGHRLTAAVLPGNATQKAVTWQSSNTGIATVDQNGYVYGVDDGTATITVRTADGGKTAACDVTVRHGTADIHVTSVAITKAVSTIALKEGAVKHLVIQVLPENASNKGVSWHTSDTDIVTVDHDGYITGVNEGTATITVTTDDGSKHDTCTVRVIPAHDWVSVTGVSLNLINTTIPVGFTDTLRYEITPSDASDLDVRWSSSNSAVAAVNATGRVEAKTAGTAVITATTVDGNKTASCLVVVSARVSAPAHGILLNKTASAILVGEFDYPAVLFYPANEDNYDLIWTSSNTAVATVDGNGRVTAKHPGTAVITVTTSNHWSASYTVTVVD